MPCTQAPLFLDALMVCVVNCLSGGQLSEGELAIGRTCLIGPMACGNDFSAGLCPPLPPRGPPRWNVYRAISYDSAATGSVSHVSLTAFERGGV